MNNLFNNDSYFIIVIIMIICMVIFGNSKKNNNNLIEYDSKNYQFLNSLTIFEKELQKYNTEHNDFKKITNEINLTSCFIPNIVDVFFINIKPSQYFDIRKHIENYNLNIMVIYNHNNLIDNTLFLLINKNYECINNHCNNFAHYYEITKKISILDIFPIYNNSNYTINITVFIIKKSFWFY